MEILRGRTSPKFRPRTGSLVNFNYLDPISRSGRPFDPPVAREAGTEVHGSSGLVNSIRPQALIFPSDRQRENPRGSREIQGSRWNLSSKRRKEGREGKKKKKGKTRKKKEEKKKKKRKKQATLVVYLCLSFFTLGNERFQGDERKWKIIRVRSPSLDIIRILKINSVPFFLDKNLSFIYLSFFYFASRSLAIESCLLGNSLL